MRAFHGPDARVECQMVGESGKTLSRCIMVVACVDRNTNRGMDWPPDAIALFFRDESA